ncbi:inositol monophosphatase family protein [Pseudogemmobacter sonorensis]|uniref:inositol monophosphatase family protein n=1 Tax=Pseudogemmobacter sonorensis TaxID=2989681 RepID=UPI0036D1A854
MQEFLLSLAHEAGALAMTHFGRLGAGAVSAKGPLDLVTVADRAVEALIVERLRAAFPEDGILGEEGSTTPGRSGRVWVIDPIDGTFNFVRGGRQWSVSIGLYDGGRPALGVVHAPVEGMVLIGGAGVAPQLNGAPLPALAAFDPARASVGFGMGGGHFPLDRRLATLRRLQVEGAAMVRVCNCATAAMIEVATGEADAYVGYGESAWDVMGIWPILTALGAAADLDWRKVPLDGKLRFVIGKPGAVALVGPLLA